MTDYAYEALAAVTQTDMTVGRGELNAALKQIREQTIMRGEDLAGEIEQRARGYRRLMPEAILTPTALAKHWHRCATLPSQETNRTVNVRCETCGGDRFVTYAYRRPEQTAWMREHGIQPSPTELIEESAACPDCNPVDASYWRHDGTKHEPPDPAKVREMIQ